MAIPDKDKLFQNLEKMGEQEVRIALARGAFAQYRRPLVELWLSMEEKKKEKSIPTPRDSPKEICIPEIWNRIQSDYDISKISFGRKINFIRDKYIRNVIFRDIAHAYFLAHEGMAKPAVILSGSVLEALLHEYLVNNGAGDVGGTLNEHIKACEKYKLLKSSNINLSHSVREFRNLVHLNNERSKKDSISKSTAILAVSSIFSIVQNF